MTRGLVIGKFMPVHAGHLALIDFAKSTCDEVMVSMSYTADDAISCEIRCSWLQQIFGRDPKVKLGLVEDDFDDPTLPLSERTKLWADIIRKKYPPMDFVFSSEEYGAPFATHLGAKHLSFDPERKLFPVSATMIREKPFTNWNFIPHVVRPYFVKKICFYGPESVGKSSMALRMAEKYNTISVPEVAREMLTTNDFSIADIVNIGLAHEKRIYDLLPQANKFLFCDTDAITTQIYSQHYLHVVPEILFEIERRTTYDHYFLFDIDVPWVSDGLRDLGNLRENMFLIFKSELEKRHIDYTLVRGGWHERENMVTMMLDNMLRKF